MSDFVKHDKGKPRPELLPALALMEVAKVLRDGAVKYTDDNWNKCNEPRRYKGAVLRHQLEDMVAQMYPDLFDREDAETHILHLAHSVCSGLFELELVLLERLRKERSDAVHKE